MNRIKTFSVSALYMAVAVSLYACGGGSSSSSSSNDGDLIGTTSTTYNGVGSRWELTVNSDATCDIQEKNSNLDIDAACTVLGSGFTKITVNTVSNSSTINAGDVTYGFELPGFMFPFVAFDENKLVPTVIGGECPSSDIQHNVIISYARSTSPSSDFDSWGAFGRWASSGTQLTVNVYNRTGTEQSDSPKVIDGFDISTFCTNGETYIEPDMSESYPATTTAYWTNGGGLIWNQVSATDDRIENDFMIPVEAGLTDLTAGAANGSYFGYKITGNGQSAIGYTNVAVSATASGGSLELTPIDPETGEATGATGDSITLSNYLNDGLFNGTLATPDGNEGIGCAYDLNANNSGKNVIICGGMKPDGSLQQLYSLILVEK